MLGDSHMNEKDILELKEENIRLKAKLELLDFTNDYGLIEIFVQEKIRTQIDNERLIYKINRLEEIIANQELNNYKNFEKEIEEENKFNELLIEYTALEIKYNEALERIKDLKEASNSIYLDKLYSLENKLNETIKKYEDLKLTYDNLLLENRILEKNEQTNTKTLIERIDLSETLMEEANDEKNLDNLDSQIIDNENKSISFLDSILDSINNNDDIEVEKENNGNEFSQIFKRARIELEEESKSIINRSDRLLPLSEFFSKEYLEKNKKKFLDQIKHYYTNKAALRTNELFIYLISFTFYYYKDGNLWNNLMNFLDIKEDYGDTLRDYVKEITEEYNYVLIKNENTTEIVETLKLHSIIPLHYLGSYLQDIYMIYLKLNRTPNKGIFYELLEEKLGNDVKLSALKTIKNLYNCGKKDELMSFSFDLLIEIDNLDKNTDLHNLNIPTDILNEVKNWYENDYKYSQIQNFSEKFEKSIFQNPKISVDFITKTLLVEEFFLPEDKVFQVNLKITSYESNEEKSRKFILEYVIDKNYENTVLVPTQIIKLAETELLGKFQIFLGDELVFTKEITYLILDESNKNIKNLRHLNSEVFSIIYLDKFYEILSESTFELEKYTSNISKAHLSKYKLNYLRNKYNKTTIEKLSIATVNDVHFISQNHEIGLTIEGLKVLSDTPFIEGFMENKHLLFHNNKKIDFVDYGQNKIGENYFKIVNKDTNRTLKEFEYFYLPNFSFECLVLSDGIEKSYIYGETEDVFLTIISDYIENFTCNYDYESTRSLTKVFLNEADIKENDIKFNFKVLGKDYKGAYKLPKLEWFIENKHFNKYGGYLWKEDLRNKRLKITLDNTNSFDLSFCGRIKKIDKFGYSVDIPNLEALEKLKNIESELFKVNFIYKGKKCKEDLFELVLSTVLECEDKFIIYPLSKNSKLEVIRKNSEDILSFSNFTPLEVSKKEISGSVSFNIYENSLFGMAKTIQYKSKIYMVNKDTISIGDEFIVKKLITKDNKEISINSKIVLIYSGLDEYNNATSIIKNKNKIKLHFNFDFEKLEASRVSIEYQNSLLPYRYLLNRDNTLRDFEVSRNEKGENAFYTLLLEKL